MKALDSKCNTTNFDNCPRVLGSGPVMLFNRKSKLVSLLSMPIVDGSVPVNLMPSRKMAVIIPLLQVTPPQFAENPEQI